jgi:hypothetical protein
MSTSSSHQPVTDVQPAQPRTATGFKRTASKWGHPAWLPVHKWPLTSVPDG